MFGFFKMEGWHIGLTNRVKIFFALFGSIRKCGVAGCEGTEEEESIRFRGVRFESIKRLGFGLGRQGA